MKTAQEWYDEGDALLYKGKYEDASKCYGEALALDNKFMPAYRGKFRSLSAQGKYQEVVEWCDKSLEIDPTYRFGLNSKGCNLESLGRYSESLVPLNKAIELYPTWDFPYLNKGNVLRSLGKREEAIENYKKYLEFNTDDSATAFSNIAVCYWDLGKYEEAKEWFDKAIAVNPNHPNNLVNRGQVLNILGRRKEALADFRKAKKSLDEGFVDVDLNPAIIAQMKRILNSISELNVVEEEAEVLVEKANQENPVVKKLINNILQLREKKEKISDDLLTKMKNKDDNGTEALLKEMQQLKGEFEQMKTELNAVKTDVKQMKSQIEDIKEELDSKLDDFAKKLDKELEKTDLNPEDRLKVKEYFKAFVQTFSSAHVTSQVIDSGQVQLNADSAKATVLSVIVSFTPFIGSVLSTGVKSLGEFLQSKEMKTQARKIKGLASDATALSQLVGSCGYEIVLNPKKQEEILKITTDDLMEISGSLFQRISKFCDNLSEEINVYLYSELYKTSSAKLGHNDANILIEEWLKGGIDPFSAQKHFINKILSEKKQKEAKEAGDTDKVQGERSNRSSCCNLF